MSKKFEYTLPIGTLKEMGINMKKIKLLENVDYSLVYGLMNHLEQRYNCSNFEVTKNGFKASLEVTLTGDEKVYGCTPKNIKTIVKNYLS